MNSKDIFKLLKTHPLTTKQFLGVYASDKLPAKYLLRDSFLVVNLDPSHKQGSHWIAMYINPLNKNTNEYFDSYGWPVPYKHFAEFLENTYFNSAKQLQNDYSTACGQWTIFYIWQRCLGKTLREIIKLFPVSNSINNDYIMNLAIKKEFNTHENIICPEFIISQIAQEMKENNAKLTQNFDYKPVTFES